MTEEEKSFDLYVKVKFPDILSKYIENKRKIDCYYCSYSSTSIILRNVKDEGYNYLQSMHPEVMKAFTLEEIAFENSWHEENLGFLLLIDLTLKKRAHCTWIQCCSTISKLC